jgi:CMP-N-acetylneuraminic acid synthetase
MRILAIIPARAGSKGLPGKNIRVLAGRPLIGWSIAAARQCSMIDHVIVSSDGDAILEVARAEGADVVRRPAALAADDSLPKDAVRHVLNELETRGHAPFDVVVLLQPTSPLRTAGDITACIDVLQDRNADSVATAAEVEHHPARIWTLDGDGRPSPYREGDCIWAPRQALEKAFALNGAVYAVRVGPFLADPTPSFIFGDSRLVIMPRERSIDIDTLFDFRIAEQLLVPEGAGDDLDGK